MQYTITLHTDLCLREKAIVAKNEYIFDKKNVVISSASDLDKAVKAGDKRLIKKYGDTHIFVNRMRLSIELPKNFDLDLSTSKYGYAVNR